MSKDSSVKYYQDNKERLQKKRLIEDIKVFLKEKEKKSNYIVINDTKIYQKMKNKSWLKIGKNVTK